MSTLDTWDVDGLRVGVDVGGTFTDVVAVGGGRLFTAKVPSTPGDQSQGVMTALASLGVEANEVDTLAHGTTVATNALLERKGARTALVTTEGFRDVLEIGRQNRASLYDLTLDHPPPLVPRELRFTVRERAGRDGELEPPDDDSLGEIIEQIGRAGVEAVAVCFLFGFLHPANERRVGEALRAAFPDVHVALASEVLPEFREYERTATTVADAYLAPRLATYLENLGRRTREVGYPTPVVMQSSGGVLSIEEAAHRAAACVLSGPAGGVVAASFVAAASGFDDVLTFDMGGTSTDVCTISSGDIETTTESVVAGIPIRFPMIDVHTVSAGGGSIAWLDPGGILHVGPHSAGADPGPACYARGGEQPTVTDANLVLGYLADGARLGGDVVLEASSAQEALSEIAPGLGTDVVRAARGVIRVANAEMVRALRLISVERGLDPRKFTLVAFGGAGPMHACEIAEELGITNVLVPKSGGVLSAMGLALSDTRRDYLAPCHAEIESLDMAELETAFSALEGQARADLGSPELRRRSDLRYRGQSFEITIDVDDLADLEADFHVAHDERYGYSMPEQPVDIVNLRLVAEIASPKPRLKEPSTSSDAVTGTRKALFENPWREVPVLARDQMGAGYKFEGPAIVEFREATCVVRGSWRATVDDSGSLLLTRHG